MRGEGEHTRHAMDGEMSQTHGQPNRRDRRSPRCAVHATTAAAAVAVPFVLQASLLDSSHYTSAEDGMYDGAESGVLMPASSSINESGLQKQQGPQSLWQRIMQKVFKVSTHIRHAGINQTDESTDDGQDERRMDAAQLPDRANGPSCAATGHCAAECADESALRQPARHHCDGHDRHLFDHDRARIAIRMSEWVHSWQQRRLNHSARIRSCLIASVHVQGDVKVPLFALGLLISSTGNSILFKKMTNKMTKYEHRDWHSDGRLR